MSASKVENPCRPGTAAFATVGVLIRSKGKRLEAKEITRRSRLALAQSNQVLNALTNPFHNSALRRAGIAVERNDGTFSLERCKPVPDAHRPEPKKKAKRVKTKAKAKPQKKPARKAVKQPASSPTPAAPSTPTIPPVFAETN